MLCYGRVVSIIIYQQKGFVSVWIFMLTCAINLTSRRMKLWRICQYYRCHHCDENNWRALYLFCWKRWTARRTESFSLSVNKLRARLFIVNVPLSAKWFWNRSFKNQISSLGFMSCLWSALVSVEVKLVSEFSDSLDAERSIPTKRNF